MKSCLCGSSLFLHIGVDCGALQDPVQGSVIFQSTSLGSIATYSCFTGYALVGKATRRCKASGIWSGVAPTCRKVVVRCNPLRNIVNGEVVVAGNTVGSIAMYICNQGFTLVGDSRRMCKANGLWSPAKPFCRRKSK